MIVSLRNRHVKRAMMFAIAMAGSAIMAPMAAQAQDEPEPPALKFQPMVVAPDLDAVEATRGRGGPEARIPCPRPVAITMTAPPGAASPYLPDFNPTYPPNVGFNSTLTNRRFGHTFTVKSPGKCCQCTGGRLTVAFKALQAGTGLTSPDAGNDGACVMTSGGTCVPGGGAIWGPTGIMAKGATKTIVYDVPCKVISTGRISFYAQDDTAVTSMKLEIRGCCVESNWGPQP
jgi:hypothetical protein